jgi:hypothetical protein
LGCRSGGGPGATAAATVGIVKIARRKASRLHSDGAEMLGHASGQ